MPYDVIVLPSAQRDINRTHKWMTKNASKGLATWHQQMAKALASLESFPARCALARENPYFREELRQLLCGQYRVIFTIKEQEVHVIHIRHTSRKPLRPKNGAKSP